MESFSTRGLPVARKVSFWNEITSDTFAELEIAPLDTSHFDGTLNREHVGPVTIMEVHSAAARIQHTRAHIAQTSLPSYLLLAPMCRQFELQPGHRKVRHRASPPRRWTQLREARPIRKPGVVPVEYNPWGQADSAPVAGYCFDACSNASVSSMNPESR